MLATATPALRAARRPRLRLSMGVGSRVGIRWAGRFGPPSMRTKPVRRANSSGGQIGAARRLDRPLVDIGDLLGDPRPRVALGALAARLAHRLDPLGLMREQLQLLGERLRVGGRHEDAVDAIGDDVAVAGDRRGDDARARGHRLDQDHAEALTGE